jgi:kinesin family protein C2/C3
MARELRGNIMIGCRVRKIIRADKMGSLVEPSHIILTSPYSLQIMKNGNSWEKFQYDKLFGCNATQLEIFNFSKSTVQSAIDGFNACILAYGQTGSGKSFTMDGK